MRGPWRLLVTRDVVQSCLCNPGTVSRDGGEEIELENGIHALQVGGWWKEEMRELQFEGCGRQGERRGTSSCFGYDMCWNRNAMPRNACV